MQYSTRGIYHEKIKQLEACEILKSELSKEKEREDNHKYKNMFQGSRHCSTSPPSPHIVWSREITNSTRSHKNDQNRKFSHWCHNIYNYESAISFEAAISTTLEYKKCSDLF